MNVGISSRPEIEVTAEQTPYYVKEALLLLSH